MLSPRLLEILRVWWRTERPRPRLFPGDVAGKPITPGAVEDACQSAVHRLTSWYREGKDVQKLLPQLSVYMGHTLLAATQAYLSMTPNLLHQASLRFQRYAIREGSND
jgi:integrase